MSNISTDINTIASRYDGKKTMHYCLVLFIFSWLTLGIVPLVWNHKISDRIGAELTRRGIDYQFGAGTFWGWGILGSLILVGPFIYTHKLLTGRREGFAQLRRKNGISGFPSPRESDCDAFIAGHGSAALSTAIGIARAKKLKNEPGKVVVIVGDGAFTGGMVYEGMNNVSKLNNLIVILNDNKMSISKNVGQMANYLTKLRTDPKYSHV